MMENVVNLEMRSWCHHPMWLGTEKNMFHLISNQVQSKMKHFVVKRMDSDLYLGSLIIFLLRVSCCCFYPAFFCPAKRRDMVHLNWFEQAWGRFVRDRRCCSWMFMVESHILSSKRAWSRSGPKSAQKCTVLVRDHTKKNRHEKPGFCAECPRGSPLNFLLLNLTRQGRYRTVFGYHFVQNFDPGFCHLVSGLPPGTGILHWKCEFVTLQSRPFCRSLEG